MGGNFEFQVQDSFLEYFPYEIWRSKKRIVLSEKKPPLSRALYGSMANLGFLFCFLACFNGDFFSVPKIALCERPVYFENFNHNFSLYPKGCRRQAICAISLILDKCPSITTKPNILQKTLVHRICSKFIKI